MASMFPQPTPFMLAQSVTAGLKIPAIEIDPRLNFVQGAFIFASDIDKLSMTFKSWKEPLRQARDNVVIPSVIKNFEEEGRPGWQPLAKSTLQNRMYMGFPRGPILERTGRLRKAATRKSIWEITSAVGREGEDMLKLRTTYLDGLAPYAEFHQLGAGMRRGRKVGEIRGSIGQSRDFSGDRFNFFSGFKFRFKEANPAFGADTRSFRLVPRPFIQLTLDEETEVYSIFFMFMTVQAERFWRPGSRGLT